jgi:hypothetical protein
MAPIVAAIDVDRPADDVFAYVTDPSRFGEWQANVVGGHMEGTGPPSVGDRCITRRRIGLATRSVTSTVTTMDPPRAWGVTGIEGPIRATVDVRVEALADSGGSQVEIRVDFDGHGIGKLLVPLMVRREAQREMPENLARLMARLET